MNKLLDIACLSNKFKSVKRSGWEQHHSKCVESDADHSWGLAFLAFMFTPPPPLDREKCLELAIIHDLQEAYVGDITPHDPVTPKEKHRRELEAMKQISSELSEPKLLSLFEEFEAGETLEAQFIKQLDKLEALTQCYAYVRNGQLDPKVYEEFYKSADSKISMPVVRKLFDEMAPTFAQNDK